MLHILVYYYITLTQIVSAYTVSHLCSVFCVLIITIIFSFIIYMYNMPSPTHVHVYVCSIVYICKYCVCPHRPYDLLNFEIKLFLIYIDIWSWLDPGTVLKVINISKIACFTIELSIN